MNILNNKSILLKLNEISKKYNLSLLILFGSRAKGNYTKLSDYDFAYTAPINFKIEEKIDLFDDLMILFKTEKIDLINIFENYDVKLRYEIFFNGKLIYEFKKGLFCDLKGKAYIDYIDFKHFEKINTNTLKRGILEI